VDLEYPRDKYEMIIRAGCVKKDNKKPFFGNENLTKETFWVLD
jgi:hypothetical protein